MENGDGGVVGPGVGDWSRKVSVPTVAWIPVSAAAVDPSSAVVPGTARIAVMAFGSVFVASMMYESCALYAKSSVRRLDHFSQTGKHVSEANASPAWALSQTTRRQLRTWWWGST